MYPARTWHLPTNLDKLNIFMNGSLCGVTCLGKPYMAIYWLHFHNLDAAGKGYCQEESTASSSDKSTELAASAARQGCGGDLRSPVGPDTMTASAGGASLDPWTTSSNSTNRSAAVFLRARATGADSGRVADGDCRPRSATSETGGARHRGGEEAAIPSNIPGGVVTHGLASTGSAADSAPGSLFSPLFENDPSGLHAEDHLIRHLSAQLSVICSKRLKSVTIMQNASPCQRCSRRYMECFGHFLKDGKVEVKFIFSSLYRLRRPSCILRQHPHQAVSIETHVQQTQGLRWLRSVGLKLTSPSYRDWLQLASSLQVPPTTFLWPSELDYSLSRRGQEDLLLWQDLEIILLRPPHLV